MLAAMTLGADGYKWVSICLDEEKFGRFRLEDRCLRLNEGDTALTLKQLSPTRLVKNDFYRKIEEDY